MLLTNMGERIQAGIVNEKGRVQHSYCASDNEKVMIELAKELSVRHGKPAFIERTGSPAHREDAAGDSYDKPL